MKSIKMNNFIILLLLGSFMIQGCKIFNCSKPEELKQEKVGEFFMLLNFSECKALPLYKNDNSCFDSKPLKEIKGPGVMQINRTDKEKIEAKLKAKIESSIDDLKKKGVNLDYTFLRQLFSDMTLKVKGVKAYQVDITSINIKPEGTCVSVLEQGKIYAAYQVLVADTIEYTFGSVISNQQKADINAFLNDANLGVLFNKESSQSKSQFICGSSIAFAARYFSVEQKKETDDVTYSTVFHANPYKYPAEDLRATVGNEEIVFKVRNSGLNGNEYLEIVSATVVNFNDSIKLSGTNLSNMVTGRIGRRPNEYYYFKAEKSKNSIVGKIYEYKITVEHRKTEYDFDIN